MTALAEIRMMILKLAFTTDMMHRNEQFGTDQMLTVSALAHAIEDRTSAMIAVARALPGAKSPTTGA